MRKTDLVNELITPATEKEIQGVTNIYFKAYWDIMELVKELKLIERPTGELYTKKQHVVSLLLHLDKIINNSNNEAFRRLRPLMEDMARQGHAFGLANIEDLGISPSMRDFTQVHQNAVRASVLLSQRQLNTAGNTLKSFFELSIYDSLEKVNKETAQRAVSEIIGSGVVSGRGRKETMNKLLDEFTRRGMTAKTTIDGKHLNWEHYARTVVRSQTMMSFNGGNVITLKENGFDLIQISKHSSSCKKCQPFEGKIYSLSGTSDKYPSVDVLPGGVPGTFHPNCEHVAKGYIDLSDLEDRGDLDSKQLLSTNGIEGA